MGDLRVELERITAQFVDTLLDAARRAPLRELVEEAASGRRLAAVVEVEERTVGNGPTSFPRGVRGAVRSRAAIARREGLTRARVTQIMNMLRKKRR
jgi:hypothetical protein